MALADYPLVHHPQARCLTCPSPPPEETALGRVAILSGGTSDLPVVAEARLALACHGVGSDLVMDVGVAGIHRLMKQLDRLRSAPVLIVCAGMEGALPTVVAGLLPQPVIAVPVAVGYGVSAGGETAIARDAGQLRPWFDGDEYRQWLWGRHGGSAHTPDESMKASGWMAAEGSEVVEIWVGDQQFFGGENLTSTFRLPDHLKGQ